MMPKAVQRHYDQMITLINTYVNEEHRDELLEKMGRIGHEISHFCSKQEEVIREIDFIYNDAITDMTDQLPDYVKRVHENLREELGVE